MKNILTAELLVKIKNASDVKENANDFYTIYFNHELMHIICIFSVKNELNNVSILFTTIGWESAYYNEKFVSSLIRRSIICENDDYMIINSHRISHFSFEHNSLTGLFIDVFNNKTFYYYKGKKQKQEEAPNGSNFFERFNK